MVPQFAHTTHTLPGSHTTRIFFQFYSRNRAALRGRWTRYITADGADHEPAVSYQDDRTGTAHSYYPRSGRDVNPAGGLEPPTPNLDAVVDPPPPRHAATHRTTILPPPHRTGYH